MVKKRALMPVGTRLPLSRLALFWEGLWLALWPACAVAGLFVVLAAFDIMPHLPGWLHLIALIALAGAFCWFLWSGLRGLKIPDDRAARRRLERVNGLDHRPLETLADALAQPSRPAHPSAQNQQSAFLWARHKQRMAQMVAGLRIGWPTPKLIRRDPYALRIILFVALIAAIVPAGPNLGSRLINATLPDLTFATPVGAVALDAWISPPQYTNRPPVFLSGAKANGEPPNNIQGQAIQTPVGSMLFVQVSGGSGAPVMIANTDSIAFDTIANNSHRLQHRLDESGPLEIQINGRTVDAWTIAVIPDKPPTIAFDQSPRVSRHTALHLIYSAFDDYGLKRIDATITRRAKPAEAESDNATSKSPPTNPLPSEAGQSFDVQLLLPVAGKADAVAESFHDLTPHPWAGLPVDIKLTATDSVGQQGESVTMRFKLPERVFLHPVARDIIAARKQLTENPNRNKSTVFNVLEDIAWKQDRYDNDIVVFMALTSAGRRLLHDKSEHALSTVQQLLWETALRIEDGKVSIAENTLRQAQKALMEALARNANDAELEQLMNKLQSALSNYLGALEKRMRDMARQGQQMTPVNPGATTLQRQDLQKMIDQIRSLARSGAREQARDMLSQLQRTLENMRAGVAQPRGRRGQAAKTMNDMQRLTKAQGDLLNRTFNLANQIPGPRQDLMTDSMKNKDGGKRSGGKAGPNSGSGSQSESQPGSEGDMQLVPNKSGRLGDFTAGAALQNALRRRLGNLMQRIAEMTGEVPRPFGRAEQEMRESARSLRKSQPRRSVDAQTRVMDALQQAMKATMQQLQQQANQNPGQGQGQAPGAQARERDPFGRAMNSEAHGANSGFVAIPDKSDLQQSREIRDELRRRAGERTRPRSERDYIERLLREF